MKNWLASFGRHKALKLLALFLAVALWFAVGSEERTDTTLSMPLELANIPSNLVITSEVPPALQVRVNGPGSVVRKLTQTRQAHTIDLSGSKPGRLAFSLSAKHFNFPRGVVVSRVTPNPLVFNLSPTITRTLQIQPVLEGKPPEGLEVKGVQIRPGQITVQGPYQEIADLKFLTTLPLDLSLLTESTTVATDVDFKNLHLTPKEQVPILAEITIGPKEVTRTISGVPVAAGPKKAQLRPFQVTLTLQGPGAAVKDLKPGDLKAGVDTRNLAPGRHRLKVQVTLPPGVRLLQVQPETLTARVAQAP